MEHETKPSAVRIEIAWSTVIKLLLGVLLAYLANRLWPLFRMLIVSILLAVPLYRLVLLVCHRGWPRWASLLLASLALIFAVMGMAALVLPVAVRQASHLGQDLPHLRQEVLDRLPAGSLRNAVDRSMDLGAGSTLGPLSLQALTAAKTAMSGLVAVVVVIALAIYLMVDGPRALQWLIAYFPQAQRLRVTQGLQKIGDRMVAFIIGQCILSGLFTGYALAVLSILHVPMALLLAVIAGFLDVVPVLGIMISLVLGGTMAMTVSPTAALVVLACYGAYHAFENYFLLPKVYARKLRISTLAVLVSMIAGGMVAGVIGAIAILPLVAAYPALESLWLAPQLEPQVVKDHQDQLRAA